MGKRSFGLVGLMMAVLFVLAACGAEEEPTATSVAFNPTVAGEAPTATPSSGETGEPGPTATPFVPDAEAGQTIFTANCAACHSTTDQAQVGPGLGGVAERAATRVDGFSADEYLRQSIREPGAYVVDGFNNIMPPFPNFSDEEIQNLIAHLNTLG